MRGLGLGLAIGGVVLGIVALRVVLASRQAWLEGERHRAAGQLEMAVTSYRRAARWYTPANIYNGRALDALETIARQAAARGEHDEALHAWRSIRAAILASRSFYVPHRDRLDRADRAIATEMAAAEALPIDAGKGTPAVREEHLRLLQSATERRPVFWSFLALAGFATWVSGAFAFALRAIDDDERLISSEARRSGTVFIAGLALFTLGLWMA